MLLLLLLPSLVLALPGRVQAQEHSIARAWNEALLHAIRNDLARPPVHARNLFHTAVAMYDTWAVFDDAATPVMLGRTVDGFTCPFDGLDASADLEAARAEAMTYAAYRLLSYRFFFSRRHEEIQAHFDSLMTVQGYDWTFASTDYSTGSPAALGNYLALCLYDFGLQDGSNEERNYAYEYYEPINPPLIPTEPGNPTLVDPNRWQPLSLDEFVDQSGNVIPGAVPKFQSPEWGQVTPFALHTRDLRLAARNGGKFWLYHDPGPPPFLNLLGESESSAAYQWGFLLVSAWSSHLDPADGVLWDISPGAIGTASDFPDDFADYPDFYDFSEGGDHGAGHAVNPATGQPYAPQIVPRADYARVLAEFWADGPDSETPPGHWFTILNYVSDHPALEKRFRGEGPVLDDLEWDVKAYLALGGAVHDAAVAAWGIKGWYDYIRPISAIRSMADRGQSSDASIPFYDPAGLPLVEGISELVLPGDPLAGDVQENVGKIKVYAWRGPDYIESPDSSVAGVGWILAENWWPYQRPTFITPPFAGYISGHSTFSRAAAEVLTLFTGDEYFPGGMGEFFAPKNEFLVFEDGPSVDVTLQWATYRDASDQTSLSRIWGGIHPPADDIPGRLIGEKIGVAAFHRAEEFFSGVVTAVEPPALPTSAALPDIYPNPVASGEALTIRLNRPAPQVTMDLYNLLGQRVASRTLHAGQQEGPLSLDTSGLAAGVYLLRLDGGAWQTSHKVVVR